jgi:hypothetical protein
MKPTHQRRPRKACCQQFDGKHLPPALAAGLIYKGYVLVRDAKTGEIVGTLNKGDWVVIGEDGKLRLIREATFASKYEELS